MSNTVVTISNTHNSNGNSGVEPSLHGTFFMEPATLHSAHAEDQVQQKQLSENGRWYKHDCIYHQRESLTRLPKVDGPPHEIPCHVGPQHEEHHGVHQVRTSVCFPVCQPFPRRYERMHRSFASWEDHCATHRENMGVFLIFAGRIWLRSPSGNFE